MRREWSKAIAVFLCGILTASAIGGLVGAQPNPAANTAAALHVASTLRPASITPFFPNIRVTDNSSPYAWQVEPTMVINSSGAIFVGWKETSGPDAAGLRVGASYSFDQGLTWAPNILMNQSHPGQSCANSDTWMALGPKDRVYDAYLEFNCATATSGLDVSNTTQGNWGSVGFVKGTGGLVDKDSITFDSTGRLYAAWDEGNVLQATWSDDGGNTWVVPFNPGGKINVLGAIVGTYGNASVYITWWDFGTNNIMFESSANRGNTWSAAVRVNDRDGSAPGVGSWQIPLPAMNVDPKSGKIYVSWADDRNGNQDIYFANSTDGGKTWGTNHRVNDDSSGMTQYMVDLAVDSTGKVHAAWEDKRTGNWNIFYANSTDGGQTWTPNLKVTSAETPGTYDRPGDYFSIEAGPNDMIYVVWTDGRGTDFDIYYARMPGFPSATITLTTQPSGLPVKVDGVTAKAPVTNTWILGSTHSIGVSQTVPIVTGSRYNWTSWSDGGARTHTVSATGDATLTASFQKQFTAQASANPATLAFSVDNVTYTGNLSTWWDAGSTHWLATASPQYTTAQVRYTWVAWSDSGPQAHAVTASGPLNDVATFVQQQGLIVSTLPGSLNFTFDGANYSTTQTFWLSADSYHSLSVASLQYLGTTSRYRFLQWSDGGSASHVIHFTGATALQVSFAAEFYLTVTSPVPGASGSGWYANGSAAVANVAYTEYLQSAGQRFVFQGWGGDASGAGTASNSIRMNGPKTALALYETQYALQVTSAYGTATGGGWYANGTTATAAVNASTLSIGPGTRVAFTGWGGDATGTDASGSTPIQMDGPRTAIAGWQKQYLVTVTSDIAGVVGGGWYPAGSTVNLVAPAQATQGGQSYTFAGWSGDISGTAANLTFTASGPVTVHATWTSAFLLGSDVFVIGIALAVVIAILLAVLVVWTRRRKKEEPGKREEP